MSVGVELLVSFGLLSPPASQVRMENRLKQVRLFAADLGKGRGLLRMEVS